MSNRWSALVVVLGLAPRVAAADVHKELAAPTLLAPAEDEMMYSCKHLTGEVAVTFKPETELKDLVTWVMGFTCKNFVFDSRIVATGKKVTVIAPKTMSAADAYRTFLVALSTVGLTVVAKGNLMRIVESATAKTQPLPIYKQVPEDSDRMIRVVIRPSYLQAEALRQAFTAVKSDAGDIALIGSFLVVTDYASAVTGMISLKQLVDVPGGTEGIYTLPVRHGDAAKVAQMLTQMFAPPPGAPRTPAAAAAGDPNQASELAPSKILVDERTNTLVISASELAYQRVKALVDRIDVAIDLEGGGSIHAYQLSSAIAEEVAATLTKAIAGDGGQARPQRTGTGSPSPASPAPPAPPGAALDNLGATLQGSVRIIADKASNKLLITSSSRDFAALKDIIQQLDQPRRQVYIEAMILEVDVTNGLNFGASAHGGRTVGGTGLELGGVQLPELSSLQPSTALAAGGLIAGLLGAPLGASQNLFGAGTSIPSYGVLLQALATRSTTNILSMPSIIALDNEEAKSKIGENVPFQKGVLPAVPGTNSTTLTTNIDRQPLELELDIKPHISANDTILLEIKHNAGGLKDTKNVLGPTWTTRNVETRVVVRDQQTVLIGGLMQDTEIDGESKVPLLGDIPILGYLFKYSSRSKHKTNLLIMLTPYIIKDQSDLQLIHQRKLRQNDEFFRSFATLDAMKFEPRLDYHRKRGLIEEINRAVQGVEDDIAARSAITAPAGVPAGPIEVPERPQ